MNLQIKKDQLILVGNEVTDEWLQEQLKFCVEKITKNMTRYKDDFPSACTTDGIYRVKPNDDWTNGFWTGMLWLAYEVTNDKKFYEQAMRNVENFQQRLDQHIVLDHHDIGFLYSLSAGAGYKLTNDERCKKQIVEAADILMGRYHQKGEFIQAWGLYGDKEEYRLIIDSLLNLPLLFQATNISENPIYAEVAKKHYNTLLRTVIRSNATTYHTYYFDTQTGDKLYGATHQGNSDQSIWARGQSWAVLGIPLVQDYWKEHPFPTMYSTIVDVFISHLPCDLVPYWDFDFNDEHPSDKDSSALAIAACGLLEADKTEAYPHAKKLAKGMIYQLGQHYLADKIKEEGILAHGVYAHAQNKGVDESNLWGDYFYFEALVRLVNPLWQKYW